MSKNKIFLCKKTQRKEERLLRALLNQSSQLQIQLHFLRGQQKSFAYETIKFYPN